MNRPPWYLIITVTTTVIAGLTLGGLTKYKLAQSSQPPSIPIPQELLASYLIKALYANVEGKVAEKGPNYIILQKGNYKLRIRVAENIGLTTFQKKTPSGSTPLNFKDINIGDALTGGVSIVMAPSLPGQNFNRGDIVAHALIVTPTK